MYVTGKIAGRGLAYSAVGQGVPYEIVAPEKTIPNLQQIAREARRWQLVRESYGAMRPVPAALFERAWFAEETIAVLGEQLRLAICCWLIAQRSDGEILGVANYHTPSTDRSGDVALLVIDPRHLAGSPGNSQLRGIGTALTAAMSRRFLAAQTETVFLHPLDAAADRFWRARGFVLCGQQSMLCIRGERQIASLLDGCTVRPDDPGRGDVIECGVRRPVSAYTALPRV